MDRVQVPLLLRALADAVERGDATGDLDIDSEPTVEKKPMRPGDLVQEYQVIDAGETWKMNVRTKRGVARPVLMELAADIATKLAKARR